MEHRKAKSAGKLVLNKGVALTQIKLDTMAAIEEAVGGTLGPGGHVGIIERLEHDMDPLITKDGVTVFKSLGFTDSYSQLILEAARGAAIKTANEAGDGTTTATILSYAFVKGVHEYCEANPTTSPALVIRELYQDWEDTLRPVLDSIRIKPKSCDFEDLDDKSTQIYRGVANISANGDAKLADAVIGCYALVGDYGNVTIVEASGNPGYEAEPMQGYFLGTGYEDLKTFYSAFINDAARQSCRLVKPKFLLYNGKINSIHALYKAIAPVAEDFEAKANGKDSKWKNHDVVVVATGFSEQVLATLASAFPDETVMNIYPLVVPLLPMQNGQFQFLQDLSAITGAKIFDPLKNFLETATPADLGPGVDGFEAFRFKSMVEGVAEGSQDAIFRQADAIRTQLINPESQLDQIWLQERLAKITNGVARLIVRGSSNVEVRERKDRAEDAVCAVKGAIHHGVLPGGCWALRRLAKEASRCQFDSSRAIFTRAFAAPFDRLIKNAGIVDPERISAIKAALDANPTKVYDAMRHELVDPGKVHLYDSYQAVFEAIKNSMSIASVIGYLGVIVAFPRDNELERSESQTYAASYREMKELK